MKNKSAMPHRLFFIVVGDISFSAGSRTLFRELILAWKRMGIDVQCRIYQLRTDVLPEANADGTVRLKDFPDPVYSPTTKKLFDRLPRQLFRLYERMVIAGCLWRWLREIRAEDRLVLNGCLGLLHLLPIKSPSEHRWWYKVGVIEEEAVSGLRFRVRKWIESWNANRLGKRMVVSRPMGEFLEQAYGYNRQGVFIVPCLVNEEQFNFNINARDACRSKMGLSDKLVVLYLGSAEPQQSPVETIAFFKALHGRFANAYFWILSHEKETFKRLLCEAELPSDCWHVDSKPYNELGEWLPAADIGCLMRPGGLINRVSSPVKFPEYMINGLSVVVGPEVGEYTELVRKEKVGVVVDPGDDATWVPAIEALSTLLEDRESLRKRCFKVARQLSWQGNEQRISDEFF